MLDRPDQAPAAASQKTVTEQREPSVSTTTTTPGEQTSGESQPAKTKPPESADNDADIDTQAVEAEVRMSDGATYVGKIYVHEDQRVLDFLNDPIPFFALTETSGKVRLLSKAQVLQIVPYDRDDVTSAASRGGGSLM